MNFIISHGKCIYAGILCLERINTGQHLAHHQAYPLTAMSKSVFVPLLLYYQIVGRRCIESAYRRRVLSHWKIETNIQCQKSFSRSLHNTRMPILPTSFWMCHSKLKRPKSLQR